MRTIYLDPITFTCHAAQNGDGTCIPHETDFFDGKCNTFIEGYRFVPSGATWTREDGITFSGEMVTPWKDWRDMDDAQRAYERQLLARYEQALSEIEAALGVSG